MKEFFVSCSDFHYESFLVEQVQKRWVFLTEELVNFAIVADAPIETKISAGSSGNSVIQTRK